MTEYWYSLRFQRPRQFLGRLRYWAAWKAYPRIPAAARMACGCPADSTRPRPDFSWPAAPPPYRPLGPGVNPESLLARFHANYFDWAAAIDPGLLVPQALDWIAANPPGTWPSWHPYPTSLRIVNWIRAFGPRAPDPVIASLAAQAGFLEHNLETHLGGNHLLENALALLAAGLYFEGPGARRRVARGLELLSREIQTQVLRDGGHCERSPYYHARMTRLLTDAIALLDANGIPVPSHLHEIHRKMEVFHSSLRHLDGSLPAFHDALYTETTSPPPSTGEGPVSFPESGYYILDAGSARLIADYGAPADAPNPGHQHAGIFSFEVSTGSGRVIVDAGTETYEGGPRRDRLRSTAAHNTVRIDGQDQFHVWGGFRVGRRARVSDVREQRKGPIHSISAVHDGYRRLGVLHRRSILCLPDAGWLIVDDLTGRGRHEIESYLHLAPGITPTIRDGRICLTPVAWTVRSLGFSAPARILEDEYSPALGERQASLTLVFRDTLELPSRVGYFVGPYPPSERDIIYLLQAGLCTA